MSKNRFEGGVFFSKIDSKGKFFLKFEEFFIRMIILQKVILYTPAEACIVHSEAL